MEEKSDEKNLIPPPAAAEVPAAQAGEHGTLIPGELGAENLPAAPTVEQAAAGEGTPGTDLVKIGKKSYAAIYIEGGEGKAGQVAKLSDREALVLRSFLKNHSYELTAKEAEISKESVQRMLRRPNLKAYLDAVIRKAAIMEGVDLAWAVKELVAVWEGAKKPDAQQMAAMREISKIVQPKTERGGGTSVQVQVNSYAAGMNKEALEAEVTDARECAGEE